MVSLGRCVGTELVDEVAGLVGPGDEESDDEVTSQAAIKPLPPRRLAASKPVSARRCRPCPPITAETLAGGTR
jgi:hypothetical protein